MRLKTVDGDQVEIADAVILAAAGAIYQSRRKTHGGPARRPYTCRWCKAECSGRVSLLAHERMCTSRPTGEFTDADLAAIAWPPESGS
jgi:hypothetical protein